MKRIYLFFTITGLIICSQNNRLFAQDKQVDFKIGSGGFVYTIAPCGEDDFFIVYGKQLLSKQAKKNVMKLDKNLQPVWKAPVVITGASVGGVDIYSYTNPADKITISYLFGAEVFLQVLPDGTTKAKKTDIPAKELENIAAVFTDSNGLNIITLNGDKKYPTGNMNWYLFSHDQLTMTKKNIILPLPSGIDKDNESGWRLNQVAANGLYFSYVSYKNNVKEPGSILFCNIIKVNDTGKPDKIINIDMEHDKYIMIPARYIQNNPNLSVFRPFLFESDGIFTDNSYMGVQVDEINNRIYTIIITNDDLKVDRDGKAECIRDIRGLKPYSLNEFEITVFDMTGKKIRQSIIDRKVDAINFSNYWAYQSRDIILNLLQNNEGIICKAKDIDNGYIFSVDQDGKTGKENKFEPFAYKKTTAPFYNDVYSATYTTMKDFENSPYIRNIKSPEVQFFNKMDKKAKQTVSYLSLKSGDIFFDWDSKNDLVKLSYFNKNLSDK